MNHTEFGVSRFENRNGVTSWRVTGWLHGVRIRKNFKTREEAAAEKAVLELSALQATAGMRAAMTFLADEQLRQAEDAFRRIDGRGCSLLFYLDYALANYRAPEHEQSLTAADTLEMEDGGEFARPRFCARFKKIPEAVLLTRRQGRASKMRYARQRLRSQLLRRKKRMVNVFRVAIHV
jgi:hypothetical protein